ncbi:caveolin-1-like [Gigantopelta aegis]|uniref:caveolin-1-like n=1 Tax=Gigantopelta aegis TaxID=1735272 RepID=UPI001B88773F|nr:caveolin-1-like [Gigantopelta aegis]
MESYSDIPIYIFIHTLRHTFNYFSSNAKFLNLQVTFDEIFAEPHPTVFSFDKVWILSYKVFTNTKLWTYRIITLLLSIPLSAVWGVYFACLAFCTIWCCRPCIKSYDIELSCLRGFWEILLSTFYRPCFESIGYCFYNIRIRTIKETV